MAKDNEAVGRPRVEFDRKRSIGAAMTGSGGADAITADDVTAEGVGNCAWIHHGATACATATTMIGSAVNGGGYQ
jgi:hypothetical protein